MKSQERAKANEAEDVAAGSRPNLARISTAGSCLRSDTIESGEGEHQSVREEFGSTALTPCFDLFSSKSSFALRTAPTFSSIKLDSASFYLGR